MARSSRPISASRSLADGVMVLFPGLSDDGFPGLFRVTGARISRIVRSLPEGGQGAGVSDEVHPWP